MEIEYLQKYKDNIDRINKPNRAHVRPATMQEIQALEAELNNGTPFPKAIRELLFIGGNYPNLSSVHGIGDMKEYTQMAREHMEEFGKPFTRPILVFDQMDEYLFGFVYLDEGDNPKPWYCSGEEEYWMGNGPIWEWSKKSFKDLIEYLL